MNIKKLFNIELTSKYFDFLKKAWRFFFFVLRVTKGGSLKKNLFLQVAWGWCMESQVNYHHNTLLPTEKNLQAIKLTCARVLFLDIFLRAVGLPR